MAGNKLGEGVDHRNDRFTKIFLFDAGGAP
ncbi:Uncharacterised protein [Vibrio cholerae]|nr:Uncharacterised protein [Vibrio cholerae]